MSNYGNFLDLLNQYNLTGIPSNTISVPGILLDRDPSNVFKITYTHFKNYSDVTNSSHFDANDLEAQFIVDGDEYKHNINVAIEQILNPTDDYSVLFSDVAAVDFTESTTGTGIITFAQMNNFPAFPSVKSSAVTYMFDPDYTDAAELYGDIWINLDADRTDGEGVVAYSIWEETDPIPGTAAYKVLIEEISHALGIDIIGPDYVSKNSEVDNHKYTITSYNSYAGMYSYNDLIPGLEKSTLVESAENLYPSGLQLLDIAALQEIYGRNYNKRSGDTFYDASNAFSSTQEDSAFVYTIWDGNGTDTIDASAFNSGAQIDLRQGAFSSIGNRGDGTRVQFDNVGNDAGNLAIAYYTIIENATGTSANDILVGNAWNNHLIGGAGNDRLFGDGVSIAEDGDLAEKMDASSGFVGWESASGNTGPAFDASGEDTLEGGDGDDSIYSGAGVDHLYGQAGHDLLKGGDGDDIIEGGAGNDKIYGGSGADEMIGGTEGDIFYQGRAGTTQLDGDIIDGDELLTNTNYLNDTLDYRGLDFGIEINTFTTSSIQATAQKVTGTTVSGNVDSITNVEHFIGTHHADRFIVDANEAAVYDAADGSDFYQIGLTHSLDILFADSGNSGYDKINVVTSYSYDDLQIMFWYDETAASYVADIDYMTLGYDSQNNPYYSIQDAARVKFSGIEEIEFGSTNFNVADLIDTYHSGGDFKLRTDTNAVQYVSPGTSGSNNLMDWQNDIVTGSSGPDYHVASFGNDTFYGAEGNDTVDVIQGNHTLTGGGGFDQLRFWFAKSGVVIDANLAVASLIGGGSTSTFSGFERLDGSDFDDFFIGGMTDETISGRNGYDIVDYSFASSAISLTHNGVYDHPLEVLGQGTDKLYSIEKLIGSDFDDNIILHSIKDLDGGEGTDTLVIQYAYGAYIDLDSSNSIASYGAETSWSGTYRISNFENIQGNLPNETFLGSSISNDIFGGGGDDLVFGRGGDDNLFGDDGNDILHGDAGNDFIAAGNNSDIVYGGDGNDNISGGNSADTLWGDSGSDTIHGDGDSDFISGGDGDDLAYGDDGNDDLYGGNADDTLDGGTGNDRLFGDAGNDIIFGSAGSDIIDGGAGDDFIQAGDDDDVVVVSRGSDILDGGTGIDTLSFINAQSGVSVDLTSPSSQIINLDSQITINNFENVLGSGYNDIFVGNSANNNINGGNGVDTVDFRTSTSAITANLRYNVAQSTAGGTDTLNGIENIKGSSFNDEISGDDISNNLEGNAGNDRLFGRAGDDSLTGGEGNDTLDPGLGLDVVDGGAGNDSVIFENLEMELAGSGVTVNLGIAGLQTTFGNNKVDLRNIENVVGSINSDTLNGNNLGNVLEGHNGDDSIFGNGGNDTLTGGNGNDFLDGGVGNDYLYGGDGDDNFVADVGNDFYYGGTGNDIINYSLFNGGVSLNLSLQAIQQEVFASQFHTIMGVENIIGSNYADNLFGSSESNEIYGGNGADNIKGMDGDDILFGDEGDDSLEGGTGIDQLYAGTGNDFAYGGAGNDFLYGDDGADYLSGEGDNDSILGAAGNDQLFGGTGDDLMYGGEGVDTIEDGIGNDLLDGGNGLDTARYINAANAVTVSLALTGVQNTGVGQDTLVSIENLTGSAYGDNLTGDNAVNILIGNAGDDFLYGLGGDDILIGGLGNDYINGGLGWDFVSYADASSMVVISLSSTGPQQTSGGGYDTIVAVENVIGSSFNDYLYGTSQTNYMDGGLGDDYINGNGGFDTVCYRQGNAVTVDLQISGAQNTIGAGIDTLVSIENVLGSYFNDTLSGTAVKDFLSGSFGDDVINGRQGDDVINGGSGQDILTGGLGADIFRYGLEPLENTWGVNGVEAADEITDFSLAQGDKIDISGILFGYDDLQSAIDDFVTLTEAGGNTTISVDRDGQGTAYSSQAVATLTAVTGLDADLMLTNGNLIA